MPLLWAAIHPRGDQTRILVMDGPDEPVLKARLDRRPHHPRALPTLLEALALWDGVPVRAALVADDRADSCGTSLFDACFGEVHDTPLFSLELVPGMPPPRRRRRDVLGGVGDFRDLERLILREVAR